MLIVLLADFYGKSCNYWAVRFDRIIEGSLDFTRWTKPGREMRVKRGIAPHGCLSSGTAASVGLFYRISEFQQSTALEFLGLVEEWCLGGMRNDNPEGATDPVGPIYAGVEHAASRGSWSALACAATAAPSAVPEFVVSQAVATLDPEDIHKNGKCTRFQILYIQ